MMSVTLPAPNGTTMVTRWVGIVLRRGRCSCTEGRGQQRRDHTSQNAAKPRHRNPPKIVGAPIQWVAASWEAIKAGSEPAGYMSKNVPPHYPLRECNENAHRRRLVPSALPIIARPTGWSRPSISTSRSTRRRRGCAPTLTLKPNSERRRAGAARARRRGARAARRCARRRRPAGRTVRRHRGPADHRAAAAPAVPARDRDRRSIPSANTATDGPLSLGRHLLHAVRGRGLSPHHLFPRPAGRDGGLHHPHRGRQSRRAGAARQRQSDVEAGDVPGTSRHFAVWHDPFPKPSYLFALVGGKLACVEDSFRTMSGRDVTLRIYVEPGKEDALRLRHGLAQARHALGREGVRPRIRSRHFHDRRGVRLQHGRDGEQGPQRLQRQIRARLAGDRDRRRLRRRSRRSSRTNISTTGPATASPAATGSSSASRKASRSSATRSSPPTSARARSSASATCAACAPISSSRTPARSPIRCGPRSITRSTISTRRPSTRRAPRSCACSRRCSARTISARAWISISTATTARPRPSSSSCNASPTCPAATSRSSCSGTRRPARRRWSPPAATMRAPRPIGSTSRRTCRRHPASRPRSRW